MLGTGVATRAVGSAIGSAILVTTLTRLGLARESDFLVDNLGFISIPASHASTDLTFHLVSDILTGRIFYIVTIETDVIFTIFCAPGTLAVCTIVTFCARIGRLKLRSSWIFLFVRLWSFLGTV